MSLPILALVVACIISERLFRASVSASEGESRFRANRRFGHGDEAMGAVLAARWRFEAAQLAALASPLSAGASGASTMPSSSHS